MGEGIDVALPRTPPRADADAWSDADGSPLPTPPRVSHVYDATEMPGPRTPPALRSRGDTAGPSDRTYRAHSSRLLTPGWTRASSLATSQRSVGRSLQKLRSSARAGQTHIPARRVQRYQDDEDAWGDETETPSAPPPSAPPLPSAAPSAAPAAPAEPVSADAAPDTQAPATIPPASAPDDALDFLVRLRDEAAEQHRTGFVPANPHRQKTLAKETTFRGCRFIKVRRAGEGGFSTVWQVRGPTHVPTVAPGGDPAAVHMEPVSERVQGYFAMKQVSLRRLEPASRDEVVQEAQLLEQLAQEPGHEAFILRYFGHRLNRDTLKMLLELGDMDFGHLLKTEAPLDRARIDLYWEQMLEAVQFVHEKGNLVHTDLKPANFLMAKGRLKLIDFGIAQKIPIGTIHISRDAIVGTPNYMAPEAIKIAKTQCGRVYKAGKASDVWSMGCILYQMVYGRPPFDKLSGEKKLEAIMDPQHMVQFPPHRVLDDPTSEPVDEELVATMRSALTYEASARATIPDLLRRLRTPAADSQKRLEETVTLSRHAIRSLVARVRQLAVEGALQDDTTRCADALFDEFSRGGHM
ncbi:dual-specificity kinase [Malassezia nana]|uniref:Dual-specificity kinase n=1 Tax=Malassezia nana TaxID=180528 RepID=A0AAF0J723_9BASI|nr:dual-specificity kinase [Malassezia nana]